MAENNRILRTCVAAVFLMFSILGNHVASACDEVGNTQKDDTTNDVNGKLPATDWSLLEFSESRRVAQVEIVIGSPGQGGFDYKNETVSFSCQFNDLVSIRTIEYGCRCSVCPVPSDTSTFSGDVHYGKLKITPTKGRPFYVYFFKSCFVLDTDTRADTNMFFSLPLAKAIDDALRSKRAYGLGYDEVVSLSGRRRLDGQEAHYHKIRQDALRSEQK